MLPQKERPTETTAKQHVEAAAEAEVMATACFICVVSFCGKPRINHPNQQPFRGPFNQIGVDPTKKHEKLNQDQGLFILVFHIISKESVYLVKIC